MALTTDQKYTTAGLLACIGVAALAAPYFGDEILCNGIVFYGIGVAFATTFYRVANLLKNGKAEDNQYGDGLFAGLAFLFSYAGCQAAPLAITKLSNSLNISSGGALILGVAIACGGFLQTRSNFADIFNNDESKKQIS